ncbi:hypothetical protein FISHEDRAFT_65684 [Fistulina hepatica ATCC 64428]|uniref:DNA2/NAM7 helicase-like C-terminal domain-containing protein n=1 Tax=Fistulina hepatica ATCC 64428 TaxID=1128425 RepID=A0A0D7AD15_9AGAR|nr:hypothetical protein FISHEDRAFT_65684 [Fistulina hepatica ATCC 64428]
MVDFPVVFLDEASISTESASLIPLTMKGSRHVSLVGDHKQLPPVILSSRAFAPGFSVSLFERLIEEGSMLCHPDVPNIMLNVQYRMHLTISQFPSSEFYNFELRDGTSSRDCCRINHSEANIVASLVEDFLLKNPQDLTGDVIGIIAPYAAQVSLITPMFSQENKYTARFNEVPDERRVAQVVWRQKDVIAFSTVHNNPRGYIASGVAVSGGAESWRRYIQWLNEQGLVLDLTGNARAEMLLNGNLVALRPTQPLAVQASTQDRTYKKLLFASR